ncbi:MAG TPA: sigma-70 family RNA polymerase sigma factor [Bacteroidota bacterium]|nr:sigma-70 family RNA polymerase sigma factor [Bacteroidota bacterium]
MSLSDSEIVDSVRGGKKHDYARLVERYEDKAFTLCVRILKNREDAEEAAQDAFVRAYNALGKFEGTAKFGTWFYRIVYNVCLTRLGKRRDEFQSTEYVDGEVHDDVLTPGGSLERDIETKDMVQFVKRIVEILPEKYSAILTLYYLHELSHEEICEVTRLPLGTVKVRLFRARALLQKRFTSDISLETV